LLAGRLTYATGTFVVDDVPVPEPGPGQVLIKVEAAGVCLSDLHLIEGMLKPATSTDVVTLGHEVAGTVHTPRARGHRLAAGRAGAAARG
jgi:D-arabinose 1-dehydrogenase-like Zn-dependent alcohol dehydrogenase